MAPHNTKWLRDKKSLLPRLLDQLNAALSEEWLAHFQYWTCSRLVEGDADGELARFFEESSKEEKEHADLLADRILQLGGIPPTTPQEWYRYARCTFDTPVSFAADYLLRVTRIGEECAMRRYRAIAEMTVGVDPLTHSLAMRLYDAEKTHVEALTQMLAKCEEAERTPSASLQKAG